METEYGVIGQETSLSFGEVLRRERRLRGLTLREASAATKVRVHHLQALEANDFAQLPGGAYNKGFLRAYAQFIGLDPEEMVNHYLFEISSHQHETENPPIRQRAPVAPTRLLLIVLAGLILVTAAVVWFIA
ncbi:MAG: helix-turn-helix domain-containing protein [Acidobacteriota bacterium]